MECMLFGVVNEYLIMIDAIMVIQPYMKPPKPPYRMPISIACWV